MLHHYGKTGSRNVGSTQVEKFYPVRFTRRTWLLPITTRLHRWLHAVDELRFGSYEDVKKWSTNGSQQRGKIFTGVVFTNRPKDGENVQ